jgi:hypothetical protein
MNGRIALLKGNFIMPTTDIYARTNLTRSGQPNTRFQVIIKISKARFEKLRQLPENRDQTDNQLLSKVSGQVITILCPEPGASFSVDRRDYLRAKFRTRSKDEPRVARNWEI